MDESPVDGKNLRGATRDPFKGPNVPKAPAVAKHTATTSGGGGPAPAAPSPSTAAPQTGSGSGGNGGSSGGSNDTAPTDTAKADPDVSHVSLKLGPIGQLTTYKDVARLSALPSAAKPLFIFIGVLKDGKTAVLLPSSVIQISPESDVSCKPSDKSCQTLELTSEDTVFFTIAGDPQAVHYQLNILSVKAKSAGSTKATTAALGRHSKAGAAILRDAHIYAGVDFKSASAYRWLPDRGVLVRTLRHSKAHASADGATAASSADVAAALPGLPVWHWHPGA
jgi:hypothetical protein